MSLYFAERTMGDGEDLINKAGSILSINGYKREAKNIHQEASIEGYRFYTCLKLLKKYMNV